MRSEQERDDFARGVIRQWMAGSNLSQTEAGDRLGISKSQFSEILNGTRGLSGITTLERIAEATGLSIDAVIGRSDDDSAPQLGNLAGYLEAEREVREREARDGTPRPEWVFLAARRERRAVLPELPIKPPFVTRTLDYIESTTPKLEAAKLQREIDDKKNAAHQKSTETREKKRIGKQAAVIEAAAAAAKEPSSNDVLTLEPTSGRKKKAQK